MISGTMLRRRGLAWWRAHGLALMGLGLMMTVIGAFYGSGGLLAPEQVATGMTVVGNLVGAAAVAVPCAGLGRQILVWVGVPVQTGGERALVAFLLGTGALGLVTLTLGMIGWLTWGAALVVLSVATALSVRGAMRAWCLDMVEGCRALAAQDQSGRLAFGVTVLALTTSFVLALAPPLGWDALAYHFTLARQYALRGDLAVDPVNVFMGMPQVGEMLYTLAVLLRGEGSAQLLGWLTSALAVIGLSSLTGRLIGSRWAPWSAAILFSAPTLAVWPAWGYVDFLTFGAMVATLTVLTIWLRDGQRRSLVLAGILAGVAVSAKYTALSVPVGAGLAILVSAPRSRRLTDALLFTVTAAVVFAPWLLKNAILTGNPVYPLLIDTPEMDAWRHLFYSRPDLIQRDVWHTLGRLPDAVFFGRYGIEHSDATLSPLWLLLPAIGGLAWRRLAADQARDARLMATAFGGAYLVWIVLGQVSQFGALPRLFMPVAAPLMVLAVLGLAAAPALNGPQLRFSWVLQAVVGLVLVVAAGLVGLGFAERQPLLYLAGRQTASDYKRSWQGWYQIAIETVADLPDGARTEFLWEPRALECPERCRADVIADRWYHLGRTLGGADRIVAHWRDLGFTHVLINSGAAEYVRHDPTSLHTPDDWRLLAEVRADLRLVHDFGGAYQLYEIP